MSSITRDVFREAKQLWSEHRGVIFLVFLGLIASLALVPVIGMGSWLTWMDVSHANHVGDAIGGITAPFLAALGVLLVYISFKQQYKANQVQIAALSYDRELQLTIALYQLLDAQIKDYSYTTRNRTDVGVYGVSVYVLDLSQCAPDQFVMKLHFLDRVTALLRSLVHYLRVVKRSSLPLEDKTMFFEKGLDVWSRLRGSLLALRSVAQDKLTPEEVRANMGEFIDLLESCQREVAF